MNPLPSPCPHQMTSLAVSAAAPPSPRWPWEPWRLPRLTHNTLMPSARAPLRHPPVPHLLQRASLVALSIVAADALHVDAALAPLPDLVLHQPPRGLACGVVQHLHDEQRRDFAWRNSCLPILVRCVFCLGRVRGWRVSTSLRKLSSTSLGAHANALRQCCSEQTKSTGKQGPHSAANTHQGCQHHCLHIQGNSRKLQFLKAPETLDQARRQPSQAARSSACSVALDLCARHAWRRSAGTARPSCWRSQ